MSREQQIDFVKQFVDCAQEKYEALTGEDFFSLSEAKQQKLVWAELKTHHDKARLVALVDHGPRERETYENKRRSQ